MIAAFWCLQTGHVILSFAVCRLTVLNPILFDCALLTSIIQAVFQQYISTLCIARVTREIEN